MRAGFARVHADEDAGRAMLTAQVGAKRAACRVKSRIVQRRSAGDAADSVRAEEFFGHKKRIASPHGRPRKCSMPLKLSFARDFSEMRFGKRTCEFPLRRRYGAAGTGMSNNIVSMWECVNVLGRSFLCQ